MNINKCISATVCYLLTCLLITFTLINAPFVFAGEGTFTGPTWSGDVLSTRGKVDIHVLLDVNDQTSDLDLKTYFNRISEELFDATEKQVQLGRVIVYRGGPEGKDKADLLVSDEISRGYTYAGKFGQPGAYGRIYLNPTYLSNASRPVVVHEMGHAVFNILDSYLGYLQDTTDPSRYLAPNNTSEPKKANGFQWLNAPYYWDGYTVPPPRTTDTFYDPTPWDDGSIADLMDGPNPQETEFSTPAGTDWVAAHKLPYEDTFKWSVAPDTTTILDPPFEAKLRVVTKQNAQRNNQSAWETIVDFRPSMRLPTVEPSSDRNGHDPLDFQIAPSINELSVSIDRSGSMFGEPLSLAKVATGLVVALTHEGYVIEEPSDKKKIPIAGDFLSVTAFNHASTLLFSDQGKVAEMTPLNKLTAAASIIPLTATGNTSIGAGLFRSRDTFTDIGILPRSIILLSDGQENTSPFIADVIQSLIDKNIRVFTVGLGDGADKTALLSLASATKGDFFFATNPFQLPGIFATLYGNLRNDAFLKVVGGVLNLVTVSNPSQYGLLSPQSQVGTEMSSVSESVLIDSATGEATFLVTWDKGQGTVELIDPSGQSIRSDNAVAFLGVEYNEGQGYAFYRIRNVLAGEWHIHFSSSDPEVQWELKVFGIDNQIQFTAQTEKNSYTYPESVIIHASAMEPQPVIGGHTTATVIDPTGSSYQITLLDDGGFSKTGDTNKNDGIYSGKVKEFAKDGVYTVTVAFDSQGGMTPAPSNTTGIEFAIPEPGIPEVTPQPVERFIRYKQFTFSVAGVPEIVPASIDINPETLNLKSKGKFVTAYIELPQPYEVEDIVIPSVVLKENTSNITLAKKFPVSIGDYDFDNIYDLMIKFDRAEIISYLRSKGITMQSLEFKVSGSLANEQPFEGSSVVRVIH